MTPLGNDWLTVKEVAKHLRVTTRTVWRYINVGLLKPSQAVPGGTVLISASSVEKMFEKRVQK